MAQSNQTPKNSATRKPGMPHKETPNTCGPRSTKVVMIELANAKEAATSATTKRLVMTSSR